MDVNGLIEGIAKSFDGYSRKARLYPSFLCLAPILWTVPLLTSLQVSNPILEGVLAIAGSIGGIYLFAAVARSRGKTLEGKLLKRWGGWPTTLILRHRDQIVDRYTKARYHTMLNKTTGLELPTEADENINPSDADQRYRAATTRLLEMRRDKKYTFVHQENAAYGFRRNLCGLRCVALVLLAILIGFTAADISLNLDEWTVAAVRVDLSSHWNLYAALGLNVMAVVFWLTFVTKEFVRQGANEYALALLRTLDGE